MNTFDSLTSLYWNIIALCFSFKPTFILQLICAILPSGIMIPLSFNFTTAPLSYTLLC